MPSLQQIWEDEQCPIVNGIVFATGAVKVLADERIKQAFGNNGLVFESESSLDELQASGNLLLTFYTEMSEAVDESRSIKAVCGGAGMGGDGFVALLEYPANRIQWIAFFDFANPFEDVRLAQERIIAHNNLGETWSFQIADPRKIAIEGARRS